MTFAHEKLNVYQASLDFARFVVVRYKTLNGQHRSLRDQLMRASQSISLNIAEGNGKWSKPDRVRFFLMARGSALECAAAVDLLDITGGFSPEEVSDAKGQLGKIVGMLSGLIESQQTQARELHAEYGVADKDKDKD